jgi:ribulose 1,5-bisphosphate carboxylase large subunit-like protein
MARVTKRIPGCDAAHFCADGNGNGILGNPMLPANGVTAFHAALTAAMTS